MRLSSKIFGLCHRLQDIRFGPVINDPVCGRPHISRRRVVGGEDAGFGTYPWQAIIRVKKTRYKRVVVILSDKIPRT